MRKNTLLYYVLPLLVVAIFYTPINAKGIKEKVADSYYENLAYKKALTYYVELAERKNASAEVIRKTADSYSKIGDAVNAVKWYEVLDEKGWAEVSDKYAYFLLLRKIGEYEKSLSVMKDYLSLGGTPTYFVKKLQENPNYIEELRKKNKDKYVVTELKFNSGEHDFCPIFYNQGILFASPEKRDKPSTIRKFAWDGTNFLQLYYVAKDDKGQYTTPKEFSFSKKDKYHDGPVAFNSDFSEAYLTRSNYSNKGKLGKSDKDIVEVNLYMTKKKDDGSWSALEPFPFNSDEYSTGCATLSKEGNIMVFASDMPGGNGETDLWITKKVSGVWQTPVHLGDNINTERRDNYPYLDKDGNLFFASDGGIQGLGGYDVYWVPGFLSGSEEVYNLGSPINTSADDFGFIYDSEKASGYFNSGRKGVVGNKGCDDIFAFEKKVALLEVLVIDKETREPIVEAKGCVQSELNEDIESAIALNDKAKFSRELVPNTYFVCADADGYKNGTVKVTLSKGKFVNAVIELEREKVEVAEPTPCPEITLEDIYYNFDRYEIRDDASASIDELVVFLNEYPNVRVSLVAHTDSRGTQKYNQWLSDKRAESAFNYLVSRGIFPERMTYRGAGETELVNHCADGVKCSEKEHQANRRTTIELISSDCIEVNKKPNKYME